MTLSHLDHRREWIRQRFGDLKGTVLGRRADVVPMTWPDLEQRFETEAGVVVYRKLSIESCAERVAEIFQLGADEMVGNPEISWHQDPDGLIEHVAGGDWGLYGVYLDGALVGAESLHMIRGDASIEWVWGCVDPKYRGQGLIRRVGAYNDELVARSGAQLGLVWVVTTHPYTQMAAEQAGYAPMGCLVGKRLYGGSDGLYYRHTLILYGKLYGGAERHLQSWESMRLTPKAASLVEVVRGLWEEKEAGGEKARKLES